MWVSKGFGAAGCVCVLVLAASAFAWAAGELLLHEAATHRRNPRRTAPPLRGCLHVPGSVGLDGVGCIAACAGRARTLAVPRALGSESRSSTRVLYVAPVGVFIDWAAMPAQRGPLFYAHAAYCLDPDRRWRPPRVAIDARGAGTGAGAGRSGVCRRAGAAGRERHLCGFPSHFVGSHSGGARLFRAGVPLRHRGRHLGRLLRAGRTHRGRCADAGRRAGGGSRRLHRRLEPRRDGDAARRAARRAFAAGTPRRCPRQARAGARGLRVPARAARNTLRHRRGADRSHRDAAAPSCAST